MPDELSSESAPEDPSAVRYSVVSVAVPVPLRKTLDYLTLDPISVGCRVRVEVGSRRLIGMVLSLRPHGEDDGELKEIAEVLDETPVLRGAQLQLVEFVARYYLAPIGDVVRGMVPPGLPSLLSRRVWLTNAGALSRPRSQQEGLVVDCLMNHGPRLKISRLRELLVSQEELQLQPLLAKMASEGRLAIDHSRATGRRYVQAVELVSDDLPKLMERAGRSSKGKAVIEFLAGLERPATREEVETSVGCGRGVIRRLAKLGILRSFDQPQRRKLERHRLGGPESVVRTLRADQGEAVARVTGALGRGSFRSYLLYGVTGSGKTEVYLRCAEQALKADRDVILLVPEIALVPSLASQARDRFGSQLAILHSNLSRAERLQEWERVRRGEARIVLGPRSAVFAPVRRLGLVVVDEEHDASFKQDSSPRYNGRDLALWRARSENAVSILASATPSPESRLSVERGRMGQLILEGRFGQGNLPEGILVDLRQHGTEKRPGEVSLTEPLLEEIKRVLTAGDQIILLRNRRGYAPRLLCRACGEDFSCPDCGLPRTMHRRESRLTCHYCGSQRSVPRTCPSCNEEALQPIGAGTERVEERFSKLFPEVSVDVLDADSARRPGGAARVLQRFSAGASQVLIGTQMVAKGHHFPGVALSAVLFADSYLSFPDFRAVERTYALLTQLAGRSGRGEKAGRFVVQTYQPSHYAITAALQHDDRGFAEEEMRFRRMFHYPPFTRMIQLVSRHRDRGRAESQLSKVVDRILSHPSAGRVRLAGPAPAPLERLRGKWRFQALVRGPSSRLLREIVSSAVSARHNNDLVIDVDPHDLM